MSYSANIEMERRREEERIRREEERKRRLNDLYYKELDALISYYTENSMLYDIDMINRIQNMSLEKRIDAMKQFRNKVVENENRKKLEKIKKEVDEKIKKEKLEKLEKEKLKSKVDDFVKETNTLIEEGEKIYLEKIFNEVNDVNNLIENNKIDEQQIDRKIKKLSEERENILENLDMIYDYIDMLRATGYRVEQFNYNKEKNKFFIYTEKDGKNFDSSFNASIEKNKIINLHFDGYEGDACLKDLEKIREIASKNYGISTKMTDYVGKPKDPGKLYFNSKIGGSK